MTPRLFSVMICVFAACSACMAADQAGWWNPRWRMRTTVARSTPYRDAAARPAARKGGAEALRAPTCARPVEVVVDFPRLLERAGVPGQFDPASLRVVERGEGQPANPVPFACRTELNAIEGREQTYLTWFARPRIGQCGAYDIYFGTEDRGIEPASFEAGLLPPENLVANPGFEDIAGGLPAGWKVEPVALVRLGKFAQTTGRQSLKIVVDEDTPAGVPREVGLSQKMDVRAFAGQEMVFECDLLAERATYGAPICIELQQFRADGSRIPEFAVQPRWLTIELAQGQLVQFSERGRFNPEAATAELRVRVRCSVRDADSGEAVTGPEAYFTIWLDRFVVRPGERWPWPAASQAGFVAGAWTNAPVNRAFEFTGQRRVAFNAASEGTLTANVWGDAKSVHWGLEAGTLEFWCRPSWNADDGVEHVFLKAISYLHRLQSRLRKLDGNGRNQLEFTIADADAQAHTVRGPAPLRAAQWHHVAAMWNFPKAQLQLFVDGRRVAGQGPGAPPWPSSLVAVGDKKLKGMGITEDDKRSLPMQAFIGGDEGCRKELSAEAALDEFRISDVARYADAFTPLRQDFEVDEHTRALFHFDNEHHGVHDSDDRFVYGHLFCELPPQSESAVLELLADGKVERHEVAVKPRASDEVFEANRAERRLTVTRPFRPLPDPRFVEYRERRVERVVTGPGDHFDLDVGGDFEPWMRSVTFEHAESGAAASTPLAHWRANDNVVPFSAKSFRETLASHATSDEERAFEGFKYALQVTNYYDGNYCETLPKRHRPSVAYTFVKAVNIYPFNQCGPLNFTLRKLFLPVGISSNDAPGTHHQFEQAFYRGSWRLFDLSPRQFWLNRDNTTVVSRRGLEDDPYLKIRQSGDACAWLRGIKGQASFGTAERPHDMSFLLRPGERASLSWQNEGRWFEVTGNRQPIPLAKIPPYFGNGAIVYAPVAQGDAAQLDNLVLETLADGSRCLRAKDPARPAVLVYRARCPYIISDLHVTGQYAAKEAGAVALLLSFDDGKSWAPAWRSSDSSGEIAANPRDQVTARYAYWLKLELAAGSQATVRDLKVRSTLVCSPLALPGKLSLGKNHISFVGAPASPVRTTCRWVERYRTNLGVSLNSISYYLNSDEAHRNLFIVAPGGELLLDVTVMGSGLSGSVSLEGLPAGWSSKPGKRQIALTDPGKTTTAQFVVQANGSRAGDIHAFDVVLRGQAMDRRVPVQVLVGDAALAREAERPDAIFLPPRPAGTAGLNAGHAAPAVGAKRPVSGAATVNDLAEASGGKVMGFTGRGALGFDLTAPQAGHFALWLRARWEPERNTNLTLAVDGSKPRDLRAMAMIGFTDWTDPRRAHTKMFAHFGEPFGHWSWYRVPDVQIPAGKHRLTLGADAGASFDALAVLPQNDLMDRSAMNLFQNWNFAPWDNPF